MLCFDIQDVPVVMSGLSACLAGMQWQAVVYWKDLREQVVDVFRKGRYFNFERSYALQTFDLR